jgi:hypothetical protein
MKKAAAANAFRFLTLHQMETVYFLGLMFLGGICAIFLAAGWSSYKEKKIPETPILFRWFVAGVVSFGLAAYTWIFGYGGNVEETIKTLGDALAIDSLPTSSSSESGALNVGLPNF